MVKFWARISQNKLHHINSAKILSKFCLDKFSPKLNPIWEKRVLNFKFNAFYPVNLNQHCTVFTHFEREARTKKNADFSQHFPKAPKNGFFGLSYFQKLAWGTQNFVKKWSLQGSESQFGPKKSRQNFQFFLKIVPLRKS